MSAIRKGRVGPLQGDPAQLGELVHHRRAAEAAEAAVLDAAERHLRLVADRLVVDVDDSGFDPSGERKAAVGVARDDPGGEAVPGRVRGRTASSAESTTSIAATGPNVSCCANSESAGTSARSVAWKHGPSASPPASTLAPFATASATRSETSCRAPSVISGPMIVSAPSGRRP